MEKLERQPEEMRCARILPDYTEMAAGSVLIECGRTRVICTASVEDGVPPFLRGSGKGWLTAEEIVNFIAVSESTPGPFAVNIATYIGSVRGGAAGAVCATLGVVLPSFLIILAIARCYKKFKSSKIVAGLMSGLKPAVIGLIAAAVLTVGKTVFLNSATPTGFPATASDWFRTVSSALVFVLALFACRKKSSSNINDFDCRCSRHSIRPFGRNACCLELTAALTSRTISPMRATHRIEFFPLPAVQALHCPSGRYDLN